jgi:ankyrin repeat protein
MHIAASVGNGNFGYGDEVLKELIAHKADVLAADDNSWAPLHYAATGGHESTVKILMDAAPPNGLFENRGWTPLHAAVQKKHAAVVKLLSQFGPAVSRVVSQNTQPSSSHHSTSPGSALRQSHDYSSFTRNQLQHSPTSLGDYVLDEDFSDGGFSLVSMTDKPLGTAIPSFSQRSSARNARYERSHVPSSDLFATHGSSSKASARKPSSHPVKGAEKPLMTPLMLAISQSYIEGANHLIKAGVDNNNLKDCFEYSLHHCAPDMAETFLAHDAT